MKRVVILGAGPAACLLGIALAKKNIPATLIGRARNSKAVEGLSQRVVDALVQVGAAQALSSLGPRWRRISCWGGEEIEINGEFIVERSEFDRNLLSDLKATGLDILDGMIQKLELTSDDRWSIQWEDQSGALRSTEADLIVECRGRSAPKSAPDIFQGQVLISLCRTFEGAKPQPRTSFIESIPSGWVWGGVDSLGMAYIQTVVLPETLPLYGDDLDAAHAACVGELRYLPHRLGSKLKPVIPTSARGIRPTLRDGIARSNYLRVGDAAYTCDPLSGHGIFEAASGAFAAIPVINTLIKQPEQNQLALRYLNERAESVFISRLSAANQHYSSEIRWSEKPFWLALSNQRGMPSENLRKTVRGTAFIQKAVVENNFIVSRKVAINHEHPRGVRFISGVDLGLLDDLFLQRPDAKVSELVSQLNATPESVEHALNWLARHRYALGAVVK